MFERLRTHFGTAGLVVAIVALIAALGGAAIAASGGDGGKATASAKGKPGPRGKVGKTGPQGPAGPAGPAGLQGLKGDAGAAGSNGANGANGANGTGVTTKPLAPGEGPPGEECEEGGTEVTSASGTEVICNGEEGAPGEPGATGATGPVGPSCNPNGPCVLPVGSTLTGVWSMRTPGGVQAWTSVSFGLHLAKTVAYRFVTLAEQEAGGTTECPTEEFFEPTAEPGYLCVYQSASLNNVGAPFVGIQGDSKSGFGLIFNLTDSETEASAAGTWAATAGP